MQKIKADNKYRKKENILGITTTDSQGNQTPLLFASDTDHIETRTGHTEEERYTALLKTMSKKFTSSDGSEITVNNAIEKQRVLGLSIKGNTQVFKKPKDGSAEWVSIPNDETRDVVNYDYKLDSCMAIVSIN